MIAVEKFKFFNIPLFYIYNMLLSNFISRSDKIGESKYKVKWNKNTLKLNLRLNPTITFKRFLSLGLAVYRLIYAGPPSKMLSVIEILIPLRPLSLLAFRTLGKVTKLYHVNRFAQEPCILRTLTDVTTGVTLPVDRGWVNSKLLFSTQISHSSRLLSSPSSLPGNLCKCTTLSSHPVHTSLLSTHLSSSAQCPIPLSHTL